MAVSNNVKKMLVFSNAETRDLIKNIISDEVSVEKRNESVLLESHILNDMLPANKSASAWIQFLYTGEWDISRVLNACFGYLAAGINWHAKYSNGKPLIQYAAHWELVANSKPDINAIERYHFLSQLESLVNKIESLVETATDTYRAANDVDWIREIYKTAKDEPGYLTFAPLYQFLLENWDELCDWTITYRLLSDMAAMQKNWPDTHESRYQLLNILKEVSKEWN